MSTVVEILGVLNQHAERFEFPVLDNGYVYLAATRLSAHRSARDWALVFEIFGHSTREGEPSLLIQTIGSCVSSARGARRGTLPANQYAARFLRPVASGAWLDVESEDVATGAAFVTIRGRRVDIPRAAECAARGIRLEAAPAMRVFELCRYLAAIARDEVLGTPEERRARVPPGLAEILVLDAWHHPDLAGGERPSGSEAFQQLARVLETGDLSGYRPSQAPNTHWRHWPLGGRL